MDTFCKIKINTGKIFQWMSNFAKSKWQRKWLYKINEPSNSLLQLPWQRTWFFSHRIYFLYIPSSYWSWILRMNYFYLIIVFPLFYNIKDISKLNAISSTMSIWMGGTVAKGDEGKIIDSNRSDRGKVLGNVGVSRGLQRGFPREPLWNKTNSLG